MPPPAQEAEPRRSQRAVKSEQVPSSPAPSDAAGASQSSEKRERDEGAKPAQTKRARWAQKSSLGLGCAVAAPRVASPGGTPSGEAAPVHAKGGDRRPLATRAHLWPPLVT